MDDTTWSMVDFIVPNHEAELVSDALWGMGVVAIEERTTAAELITLRTSMGDDPTHSINLVVDRFPHVLYELIQIPRSVADTWREHATVTRVNDTVHLVPAWKKELAKGEYLLIEPLDTFGLGNHPTTVLALRLALETTSSQSEVFDLGCGSGVLAIGVAKFLDSNVQAFDIAENAQKAVQMNCSLNNVKTVTWRDGIQGTTSDVVLANILAPVLIAESENIIGGTRIQGTIVLSGMRDEQVSRVLEHFTGCVEIARDSLDGWTAVVVRKIA